MVWRERYMKPTSHTDHIRKVHVIFKTHLDVGFTDTAANVLDSNATHFCQMLAQLLWKAAAHKVIVRVSGSISFILSVSD